MSDGLDQGVLCDMCLGEDKKPAQKTCTKCEISMCVQHLQTHLNTPVLLQTHPLTQPTVFDGTTKCPQHGKLLEYYCLDDLSCVCVSCAIEDQHRLHNMMTFSKAHKELTEKLHVGQKTLLEKAQCGSVRLEKWEKSEREKVSRSGTRLTEAVVGLRDLALTSIQTSVSARLVALKTSKSSAQAAQNEKDTFRFLQMFAQVHQDMEKAKNVDLRNGLEPGKKRDKLVEQIRQSGENMVKEAIQFWGSLLTLVDPENQEQEFMSTSSDLIFDHVTLNNCISLSEDKTKVFYDSWMGTFSEQTLCIKSVKTVPSFQRWVINLSKDCDWTIGLCTQSSVNNVNSGEVYGLSCQGEQLNSVISDYEAPTTMKCSVLEEEEITGQVYRQVVKPVGAHKAETMPRPRTVEVVWSSPGSLSFFNKIGQHQRQKIITINLNDSGLTPFVHLKKSPQQHQQLQDQRKCSCGRSYHRYNEYNECYSTSNSIKVQCKCPCGKSFPHITEVLCELV